MADDKGNSKGSILGMASGGLLSGAMGLAGGLVDSLDIGGNRRRKKQIEQQQKLTDMQIGANKELADYGMGISKEMFEATGYGAQRRQMEEAGLNPALMYGHAGAGGTTTSASGGSAGIGQASDEASQKMASTQAKGMALQLAKLQSEVAINKAQAKKLNSEASNLDEKSTTEIEQRDIMIEALKQEGYGNWLDNVRKDFLNKPIAENTLEMYGNKIYGTTGLQAMSAFTKEVSAGIAKGMAEAGNAEAQALLNNAKAEGYWTELLNAVKHADADAMKAAAIKLSAEWSTGEFTNWKTWVDTGINAVNTITNIVGAGPKLTGAKAIGNSVSKGSK